MGPGRTSEKGFYKVGLKKKPFAASSNAVNVVLNVSKCDVWSVELNNISVFNVQTESTRERIISMCWKSLR